MREPGTASHRRLAGTLLISVGLFLGASLAVAQENRETILPLAARAEGLEAQGQWEAAAAEYQKILKINPRSTPALNALGALRVRQGKFKEGIAYYHQALKIDPREFVTNLNLGIAYVKVVWSNYSTDRFSARSHIMYGQHAKQKMGSVVGLCIGPSKPAVAAAKRIPGGREPDLAITPSRPSAAVRSGEIHPG